MKPISPLKFTLATFAFTWLLQGIAILSGQSSKDFPAIVFYIIGGCSPSLVALFFVWHNFNAEQCREFGHASSARAASNPSGGSSLWSPFRPPCYWASGLMHSWAGPYPKWITLTC